MFSKIGVLKNFTRFTGKQTPVSESLFKKIYKAESLETLLKRDSNTGVFL